MAIVRIRSGTLRHTASVQRLSATTSFGDRGVPSGTWSAVANNVPCLITQLSGREGMLAQQSYPTATHRIELRHLAGLSPRMKIIPDNSTGDTYNIEAVDDVEGRGIQHIAICRREVST